ncbi:M28 family peptidase [Conexibacter stalactiti]|uniref:M28 family peptidase n=1 Tax=Conexibacter stalactiti TaxID=1940611 RepID=A0ABU4HKW9_9ACTN|nr:M28 family peptidase [Conexibacter stalactiti]MDW5593950.1 M28 family peptidase [Conexibacter stalactiti]MEC5034592.1 M28 family peptidase [Conexibacter stalactiti]
MPDRRHLRDAIAHLSAIDRPSASPGEREAAQWIAARLGEFGCSARVEEERAHGGYWYPLGVPAALAGVAGLAAKQFPGRASRIAAGAVGAAAAAAIYDDVSGGSLWFRRRFLPSRPTWNVVAETGDVEAEHTLVFVAHHDAAHWGMLFHPGVLPLVARYAPGLLERSDTSPPLMAPVFAGPALVALGALTGSRRLLAAGTTLSLGSAATFAEIGSRDAVPGANDNLTGVATLLGIATELGERQVDGLRVLLVSTGSEEGFMEGMHAFARRHFPSLPQERTHVVCVDTVGSPELTLIEGEGMLRMREYPEPFKQLVSEAAVDSGVHLRRGLRFRNATDGLIALKAGYPTAMIGSVTPNKVPSNYHWPTDTAENVDHGTVDDAVTLCTAIVRRLAATIDPHAAPSAASA